MPLDSHSYLVSQGWSGSGTGLRDGAITRPLAIPQKKTLAGLGKDRDEAFPFWDHLFSAASKSIHIKLASDDEHSDAEPGAGTSLNLRRTTTGILSNRRPAAGTLADSSGATTPDGADASSARLGLLALAKRDAAKRGLYSRFFRGPVLGPDSPPVAAAAQDPVPAPAHPLDADAEPKTKKRKLLPDAAAAADTEKEQRRAARRLRKEQRALRRLEKTRLKEERRGKARADAEPQGEKKKRRRAQAENAAAAGAGPAPGQSDKKGKRRRDAGPDLTQAEVGADAEIVDKKRTEEDAVHDEGAGETERKRKRKRDTDTSPEEKARQKEERRRRKTASHSVQ